MSLRTTASQTIGPYLHIGTTWLVTDNLVASGGIGERITIEGRITDADGAPVNDALIDLWQANPLNGVGPVKAQAIIDYREKNGRFKSLEDVKNVKGIGDATFDKIRGDISLTGTSTMAPSAKAESKPAAAKPAEHKAASPAMPDAKAETKAAKTEKAG